MPGDNSRGFFYKKPTPVERPRDLNNISAEIANLRSQAREMIDKNNKLVDASWALQLELDDPNVSEEEQSIAQRIEEIDEKIRQEGYHTLIPELLENIRELEVAHYGGSSITSNSPYTL
jgi:hypothetical protein